MGEVALLGKPSASPSEASTSGCEMETAVAEKVEEDFATTFALQRLAGDPTCAGGNWVLGTLNVWREEEGFGFLATEGPDGP